MEVICATEGHLGLIYAKDPILPLILKKPKKLQIPKLDHQNPIFPATDVADMQPAREEVISEMKKIGDRGGKLAMLRRWQRESRSGCQRIREILRAILGRFCMRSSARFSTNCHAI